jgi:signal transduction histidine kinase
MPSIHKDVNPQHVLIICPNEGDSVKLQMILGELKDPHARSVVTRNLPEGLLKLSKEQFDLVFYDLATKGPKGLDPLFQTPLSYQRPPVVVLMDEESKQTAEEVIRLGAQDVLLKTHWDVPLLERVFQYATERHKVMEEIRQKNAELEHLNNIKTEFISTVSHELRTPLTVILSTANNLLAKAFGPVTEDQVKWINKIMGHAKNLEQMVSDMLDLSRLQSGRIELKREKFSIGTMIKSVVFNFKKIAEDKEIELVQDISQDLNSIWGDSLKLQQVLIHLINNALKYSPGGKKITVRVWQKNKFTFLEVKDEGPGIPKDQQGSIFERFRQIRDIKKKSKATQGIGLGLTLCKEIITRHNGDIWVESEEGEGSRFTFKVPNDMRDRQRKPVRVLVVDDEAAIREMLKITLEQEGDQVAVCRDGKTAIDMITTSGDEFDVIFLDLMLPTISGIDVIKAMRKANSQSQVVIITAYPNSELLLQGMEYGPLTIVAKPFAPDKIVGIVENYARGHSPVLPQKKAA